MFYEILVLSFLFFALKLIFIYLKERKALNLISQYSSNLSNVDKRFKEILLMGIYNRFSNNEVKEMDEKDEKTKTDEIKKLSHLLVKENPLDFEAFVADIMKDTYGGKTIVIGGSNSKIKTLL